MHSYSIINEIFFGIKKISSPDDLNRLKLYYYNDSNVEPIIESVGCNSIAIKLEEKERIVEIPSNTERTYWFEPKQKDTLFWCIFAAVYGESEYLMIGSKYANRELEEKSKMISEFKKSSSELRSMNHKMTLGSIQEMMSEYMTNQIETTFLGLIGFSAYYKIKIVLVDDVKKTHINIVPPSYMKTCILYKNNTIKGFAKYRLFMDDIEKRIEDITNNSFCLEGYSKPLRAISSYKRQEIDDIAKRFGLLLDTKAKKEDLYNKIAEYVVWR